MRRKSKVKCLILLCGTWLLCVTAWAADVNLAWDHSPSDGVVGYRMYYGNASRTYTQHDAVPYQLTWTVTGLANGTYYFAVTALDIDGNESDYSNEVSTTIGTPSISCDVNGDGSVNVLDLQVMANQVLGHIPADLGNDLDRNGTVNVLDMQILANVILGVRSCP